MTVLHRHFHDNAALRRDPTRTGDIRRRWRGDLERRIATLKAYVRNAMQQTDFLNLIPAWTGAAVPQLQQRISIFANWFSTINDRIVFGEDGSWTSAYITEAYTRGYDHAAVRFSAPRPKINSDKLESLQLMAINDIDGITDIAEQQVVRAVSEGMKNKQPVAFVLREVMKRIDATERVRGHTLINSAVVAAYSEGTLDAYRYLGVKQVGIVPEFVPRKSSNKIITDALVTIVTAGDDAVCEECEDLEGITYEIEEAAGIIPVHPNCRCAWIPVDDRRFRAVETEEDE